MIKDDFTDGRWQREHRLRVPQTAPPVVQVPVDPETPVRTSRERPGFHRGARVRK